MATLSFSPSSRHDGRADVHAGGELLGTLTVEALVRLGVRDGDPVSGEVRVRIAREVLALATYDRAVNMLAAKARASRELRLALLRKGEPEELVDAAVERLRALGHLDDERFARQFTRSRVLGGGFSRRRVQGELVRRGIAQSAAREAIDEVMAEEAVDESALLLAAARKRLRALSTFEPAVRRRRLFSYLARRGFEPDAIARMLDRLLRDDTTVE